MTRGRVLTTFASVLVTSGSAMASISINLASTEPERLSPGGVPYFVTPVIVVPDVTVADDSLLADLEVELNGALFLQEPIFQEGIYVITATATYVDGSREFRQLAFELHDCLFLSADVQMIQYEAVPVSGGYIVSGSLQVTPEMVSSDAVHPRSWALRLEDAAFQNLVEPLTVEDRSRDRWMVMDSPGRLRFRTRTPAEPATLDMSGDNYQGASAFHLIGSVSTSMPMPDTSVQKYTDVDVPAGPPPVYRGDPPNCRIRAYLLLEGPHILNEPTPAMNPICNVVTGDISQFVATGAWCSALFEIAATAQDECLNTTAQFAAGNVGTAKLKLRRSPANCCSDCRAEIVATPRFHAEVNTEGSVSRGATGGVLSITGPTYGDTTCFCAANGGVSAGDGAADSVVGGEGVSIPVFVGEDSEARTISASPSCNSIFDGLCEFTVVCEGNWAVDVLADRAAFADDAFVWTILGPSHPRLEVEVSCTTPDGRFISILTGYDR